VYRIRFHGRGGQGIKTAGRILGSALFAEGLEVQDAPRYGAERRGAPIFCTVRAARERIHERGPVRRPDLVLVADDTLVGLPAAGVLEGVGPASVLVLASVESAEEWGRRTAFPGLLLTLPAVAEEPAEARFAGVTCAGAAARCLGVVARDNLATAVRRELASLPGDAARTSLERALAAFDLLEDRAGCVVEGADEGAAGGPPDWIELPFDDARVSAPHVHGAATSVQVKTGVWRTLRPVLDPERCHHCHWICSTQCPDGVIDVTAGGEPDIDYDHCKGCMVCVAVCPHHALLGVPERGEDAA
jgi:pyruvate ferredoxin oxidoreductase gamma subunit